MWHFHFVLRLARKSHWPAFEWGKAASGPPCRLDRAQGTRPSMAATAAALAEGWRGGGVMQGGLGSQKPRYLGTDKETKNYFLLFLVSSCLLVCLSARQARRRWPWVSITYTHGYAYTYSYTHSSRQAYALSHFCHLSVFLHLLSGYSTLSAAVWRTWRWRPWLHKLIFNDWKQSLSSQIHICTYMWIYAVVLDVCIFSTQEVKEWRVGLLTHTHTGRLIVSWQMRTENLLLLLSRCLAQRAKLPPFISPLTALWLCPYVSYRFLKGYMSMYPCNTSLSMW